MRSTLLLLIIAMAPAAQASDELKIEEKRDAEVYEYKYDDGRVKVEEKFDHKTGKYEYKYEGPDGKCEETFEMGEFERQCT